MNLGKMSTARIPARG